MDDIAGFSSADASGSRECFGVVRRNAGLPCEDDLLPGSVRPMLVGLEVRPARHRVDERSAASEAAWLLIFLAPKQWRVFRGVS